MSDYRVTIAEEECVILAFHTNKLECRPPKKRPKDDGHSDDGAQRVLLTVGNIRIHVGYLNYYMTIWDDPQFRTAIIATAVVIGVIALAILIVCLVMKRLYGDPIAHIRSRLNKKKYARTTQENSYETRPRMLMDMLDADLKVWFPCICYLSVWFDWYGVYFKRLCLIKLGRI